MDADDPVTVDSLDAYFSKEALEEMSQIEKKRYVNILRNYQEMKKLGLNPVTPDFLCKPDTFGGSGNVRVRAPKRSMPFSVKDDDGDWSPSEENEGRRYPRRNKSMPNLKTFTRSHNSSGVMTNKLNVKEAGTSTCLSLQSSSLLKITKNNRRCAIKMGFNKLPSSRCRTVLGAIQENPTLSIGQRDIVHLWTTAKLEQVSKDFVKVVPLPPVTSVTYSDKSQEIVAQRLHLGKENIRPGIRKNPRRKASFLVRSYEEADIREDDYIYCDECLEDREGGCPFHPLYLILDKVIPRDGSVKDRAQRTVPWPLVICQSKVKGAGLGVWTNESLPAHLLFGPYEGHFLPSVEPGKESGYGWLVRWTSSSSACIDAHDESVSNWMRFVNCSRNENETNIGAFQYKGQIYYKTLKEIKRGTELMVWYGDEYGKELGLSRDETSWRAQLKDYDGRECGRCGTVYASHQYLLHHLKYCRRKFMQEYPNGKENLYLKTSKVPQCTDLILDGKFEDGIFQSSLSCDCMSCSDENLSALKCKESVASVLILQGIENISVNFNSEFKDSNNYGQIFLEQKNFEKSLGTDDIKKITEKSLGHMGKKPLEGKETGQRFSENGSLKTHMRIHTGEKPFECKDCGQRFSLNGHLKIHMRIHTVEKPFECKDCGQRFSENGNLKRHMRIHRGEKPFEFKYCGQRFSENGDLKRHMRIHRGEKPFECKDCGQRFSRNGSLKTHMRIHTGEKPFECKDCGQRFSQNGCLKRHMRIHTGEKPFECKDCGQRFSVNGSLKRHMRIHTGEKPFECKDCGQRFSQNGDLKTHMRIHTGEKPFECKDCGQRFSQNGNLKTHMRIHTGGKAFRV